jgi:hypothetical protein
MAGLKVCEEVGGKDSPDNMDEFLVETSPYVGGELP